MKQSLGRNKLPTKWRRLRQLTWTKTEYDRDVYYVKHGELPANGYVNRPKQYRELMAQFIIEPGERIDTGEAIERLVFVDDEPPPWLLDSEGNLTAPWRPDQTQRYMAVFESEINPLLQNIWRDPANGGFRGRDSLYNRVKRDYLGITQRRVLKYLNSETVHNVRRPPPTPVVYQPLRPRFPNEHWQIDLFSMGEHEKLDQRNFGYKWILNVQDIFSKFVWLYPLRSKEAIGVWRAMDSLVHKVGKPLILHSDNGGEFVNEMIEQWTEHHLIEHRTGLPYNPSTQGSVERSNGTMKQALFKHMEQYKDHVYLDILQHFALSYNTTVHSTTRRTPYHIYFGREHITDAEREARWRQLKQDKEVRRREREQKEMDVMVEDIDQYIEATDHTTQALHQQVQKNIDVAADKMMKDSERDAEQYTVGTIVRVGRSRAEGKNKYKANWISTQYRITGIRRDGRYELTNIETDKRAGKAYHSSELTRVDEAEVVAVKHPPERPDYGPTSRQRQRDADDPHRVLVRRSERQPVPKRRFEEGHFSKQARQKKEQKS